MQGVPLQGSGDGNPSFLINLKGAYMPGTGKQSRESLKQWLAECRVFFDDTAKVRSERNWEILCPMSLVYLVYLCVYLFAVCPALDIPVQTSAVQVFTVLHLCYTIVVLLHRKKTPSVRVVNLAISLFAAQILGLSGFLGVVVFPTEASYLFPLCLVLMTQIYTRRLIFPALEVLIPSAVYLICCRMTRNNYAFTLDVISISIAIGISGAALFSVTSYKLRAYQAQSALQKMCALDPMTRVNNKPTFEFLVEEYLQRFPKNSYALAICDLDDFKNINDAFGHRVGDEVLDVFAAKLHQLIDKDNTLIAGRFGGDEFVIFFKEFDTQQEVQDRLRSLCKVPGFDFPVTCSVGIAFFNSGQAGFSQYFDAADRSLYKAKAEKAGVCAVEVGA